MSLEVLEILLLVVTGLVAGTAGGLLGIGGSVIMIPILALTFSGREWGSQHLYQAAAMVVNIAVAIPAAVRHRRAGALRVRVFRAMLPATGLAIVGGVILSNSLDGQQLRQLFAIFLLYVVTMNTIKLVRKDHDDAVDNSNESAVRSGFVGGVMGFAAGLLGIGGGGIAVPLLQVVCRLPLRSCIAVSANVMCITAVVGAALKVSTLESVGRSPVEALVLALVLAPGALIGSYLGAGLTHRLPLRVVRGVFSAVMLVVALRMGGLI